VRKAVAREPSAPSERLARLLESLSANPRKTLSLSDAASVCGCTPQWLNNLVRRATGRAFHAHLRELRIEAAKRMLLQTDLSVREVGRRVGYPDLPHFSTLFRKAVGISPRAFRGERSRPASRPPAARREPVYRAIFDPDSFGTDWTVQAGEWRVSRGMIEGVGPGGLSVSLGRELPPWFSVDAELRVLPAAREAGAAVTLGLSDETFSLGTGYRFRLDVETGGVFRIDRDGRILCARSGHLDPDRRHSVRLTKLGANLALAIDGTEVLSRNDLSPLPQRRCSRLTIGTWNVGIEIRDFALFAHPVPSRRGGRDEIELGDERVAEEDYERAIQIYEAELEARAGTEAESDLLFKIGMTYLHLGLRIRARSYLERFVARRADTAEGITAATRLLALREDDLDDDALRREIERLLERARSADLLVHLLDGLSADLGVSAAERGDVERNVMISRLVWSAAPPLSEHAWLAAREVGEGMVGLRRPGEAAAFFQEVVESGKLAARWTFGAHNEKANALTAIGRLREAARELDRAGVPPDRVREARLEIRRVLLLQRSGRLAGALDGYLSVERRFPDAEAERDYAIFCAAQLFALAGKWDQAEGTARRRRRNLAPSALLERQYLQYTIAVIRGRYEELLSSVGAGTRRPPTDGPEWIREAALLQILYELAGDASRAKRGLEAIVATVGKSPLWRWTLPAAYLLGKVSADELWEKTPGIRLFLEPSPSSLYYMLGLVEQQRGRRADARRLFRFAADADPFNFWAALLARRELGSLTPGMKRFLRAGG
jgi:AraC-like DNA-binding protein/tetratricopeptide (TPR) repeat protein